MRYDVVLKTGEMCKWRCMMDQNSLDPDDYITSAKWYDAEVVTAFDQALALKIVNEKGASKLVPHYSCGQWEGCSEIGIINPQQATERMRAYVLEKVKLQREEHKAKLEKLYTELEAINIQGFTE